jgi:hypothetical protein
MAKPKHIFAHRSIAAEPAAKSAAVYGALAPDAITVALIAHAEPIAEQMDRAQARVSAARSLSHQIDRLKLKAGKFENAVRAA